MEVGTVKIADDEDFQRLTEMVDSSEEWLLEYEKSGVRVWTKQAGNCTFKMVKVICDFPNVNPIDLYDVIHDPDYRKVWDHSMIDSVDIGHLNPNNDVSYYAVSCPTPMKNRDFVLQRSWLDTGTEQFIINHSVFHKDFPPKPGYVRANSFFTGYLIRQPSKTGCNLGYVTQSDLQGDLPLWIVNKSTHIFAPKYVRQLEKAALGYRVWKAAHNPHLKPWHYPEQITSPKLPLHLAVTSAPAQRSPAEQSVPVLRVTRAKSLSIPGGTSGGSGGVSPAPSRGHSFSMRGSLNEPPAPSRKSQLLSCLNLTKQCLGKNQDPTMP